MEAGFTKNAEIDSTPFLTSVGGRVPVGSLIGAHGRESVKANCRLGREGRIRSCPEPD